MFDAEDLERSAGELPALDPPVVLHLHRGEERSSLGDALGSAVDSLVRAADASLRLASETVPDPPAEPALSILRAGCGPVHYLALPQGPELAPFLEALTGKTTRAPGLPRELEERLRHLEEPARIEVFIAESCPHCPQAVRAAVQLAQASPVISAAIIDAQRFADLAARYAVRSAPTTVIDGGYTHIGVAAAHELAARILARGDAGAAFAVFLSLLEGGRFDELAKRIAAGPDLPHFLAAWQRSTTSSRIGLMMIAERLLADHREVLERIVPELCASLRAEDAALRGDTADLLGQIGHPAARDGLAVLLEDPNPDVREIAAEALEELR